MARPKLTKPNFELGKSHGKPNFYIKWTSNGKSVRVSTGTEDEAEAKRFLSDYIAGWNSPPSKDEQTIAMALDFYLEFKKGKYF